VPYDDYDAEDPLELVGCEVELADEHLTEMAECFVEEFARMGYGANELLELFRNPFYRGPHSVYQARGEEYVRRLIEEIVGERPARSAPGLARRGELVTLQPLPSAARE
jgi:hypothetical protein